MKVCAHITTVIALLLVSYAVNYALGGYEVAGYHLFNLLIHLACVLLICARRNGSIGPPPSL